MIIYFSLLVILSEVIRVRVAKSRFQININSLQRKNQKSTSRSEFIVKSNYYVQYQLFLQIFNMSA